jgi:hypothetical protein
LRRRAYAAHETLIEQGAAIGKDAFFVLASGRVRVFVDGRQVAVLSAGDYVGERALVLRERRASTCVADAEGCACLVLDAEAWEDAVLARGSEDLSPSKRTRRRSSWVRSFDAYAHDARDEGAARLNAFAADYAALLSETSGDGDFSSALNGAALPPARAAELRLLLLGEVTPEFSADEAVDRIIALAERVFPGTVAVRPPVAGESHRVVAADSTLAAPVTSRGRLLAILELRGGSIPPSWPAAAVIFAEALAAPLASSRTARRDSANDDSPPPPPPTGLDRLIAAHVLHRPSNDEKRLLWAAREALVGEPRALPKVLLAVDWSAKSQVREAYRLLGKWAPLPPLHALQLLSKRFPDAKVRAFAVRCLEPLGDADLAALMLQLVQVVKADPSHDTALNRFLLRRALRSPLVCGHALYWALAAEIDRETHSCRAVWKSKFYGAFVLNRRVVLHAIDATPARWRGDAGSSPLDRARTAANTRLTG